MVRRTALKQGAGETAEQFAKRQRAFIEAQAKKIGKRQTSLIKKTGKNIKKAAKKTAKVAADNAGKLIAAGLVVGGAIYLDKRFNDADEDTKNCINVCLPENWDDYKYGDLSKSELKYRVLEGEDANPDQPICTKAMTDCGEYCGEKCEDLHAYELPGSKTLEGAGRGLGGAFGGLFGGLFKGLGGALDPSGMMSKVSSVMIILLIALGVMQSIK